LILTGVQILENLANIRVPLIAAVDGRAYVHSEYALLANVIVVGEGAIFHDLPHFAGGIVPGDGILPRGVTGREQEERRRSY
jgi:enoyl-CoA hydratase/carnithine racemase